MHVLCMGRVRNISLVTRSIAAQANSRLSLAVRMLPCDARGTSSLLCVISLFLCFSVLFCFNTLLFQRIMPLSKPPLANSMSCHPRATCYIAGCCHLANSIACYPRATCTLQGAATWQDNMSCQIHVSYCRLQKFHLPFWKSFFAVYSRRILAWR